MGEIGHIGHGADIDAFVFHRCAHGEAAHAAFEKGHIIKRSLAGQVVDFVAVVVKLESVFIGRRCAFVAADGRGERNGTGEQGGQRCGINMDAAAGGVDAESGFEPELAVFPTNLSLGLWMKMV